VETLKEFRNILLGQKIVVWTDHKNLTCKNFNTDRVMRWRLILEEYGPELRYIKGERNIVADALSRLGLLQRESEEHSPAEDADEPPPSLYCLEANAECFAEDESALPKTYPLSYQQLKIEQSNDDYLQKKVTETNTSYKTKQFKHADSTFDLITKDDKIAVPKSLQRKAVEWYHSLLMHPGETRTELTIAQHFYWKGMRTTVKNVCGRCMSCTLNKTKFQRLGLLPPKKAEVIPWQTLCIDLIGPYTLGTGKNATTLHAMTMIDPATGWFEIIEIPSKRADVIADLLERTWIMRYPWPEMVVMDRGREFMAEVKTLLHDEYGIVRRPITTRNPQANSMVERAHKTIKDMIRSQNLKDKRDLVDGRWDGVLSAVGFAMRATVHTTTRATPAQLVFNRDAMHNVGFEADWQYIKQRKQRRIIQNNKRENASRKPHQYSVGDQVLVLQGRTEYGRPKYRGPYEVSRIFDNGTVELKQDTVRGGAVYQTWNNRNLTPHET
jgi:hypothetical protein